MMDHSAKIYIAGHRGLVGSAICRRLEHLEYSHLLCRTHRELDLTDAAAVARFFDSEKPEYAFLAAAKVGGILANSSNPADFILQNLQIQTNVIDQAYRCGVRRLLFLGSSCIYPRLAPQPITEDALLTGPLEFTNRPYALAKIAGIEMCWAYNRQYGTQFVAAMPTNLYGPNDNYDANNSHVIPALIRKMHEAKVQHAKEVVIWGSGRPRREFLHSDDAADALILLMNLPDERFTQLFGRPDQPPLINVGCGEDLTVRELAEITADIVGIDVNLVFDPSKPDGTPQKLLDSSRLRSLGWAPQISLPLGLASAYRDYCSRMACGFARDSASKI